MDPHDSQTPAPAPVLLILDHCMGQRRLSAYLWIRQSLTRKGAEPDSARHIPAVRSNGSKKWHIVIALSNPAINHFKKFSWCGFSLGQAEMRMSAKFLLERFAVVGASSARI